MIAYVMEHVLLTSFGGAGIHIAYLSECNTPETDAWILSFTFWDVFGLLVICYIIN